MKVPDVCERVLNPVALPAAKATDDARVAFIQDDAALITAKGEIDAGRNCLRDLRQSYSKAKK
ncbi:MAG: hypothetical protein ABSA68_13395 [Xanthobacteraceae bacterium]